jgi:hypothetical protein
MASKYDRVNVQEEKLKRLYNCNRITPSDQKYLNYQYERYKLRNFHISALAFGTAFLFAQIPIVKTATNFKYYSSVIVLGIAIYKSLTMANNRNYEQITMPYFEKYKVK